MLPHEINQTRIETVILILCECHTKEFFPTFEKLIKRIKLMMFVLKVRPITNLRIKTIEYGLKKKERKERKHNPEKKFTLTL